MIVPFIEQHLQRRLNARNTAPDRKEIVVLLQAGVAGRVIRSDGIDVAAKYCFPQRLAIRRVPQRWCGLSDGPKAEEIVVSEEEVVRTGFDRDIRTLRACLYRRCHTASGAHVYDVKFAAGFLGEQGCASNGLH